MSPAVTVYTVTVHQGRLLVDVDRYTFTFFYRLNHRGRLSLVPAGGRVLGKSDTRIARDDEVARTACSEAKRVALEALGHWLREHDPAMLNQVENRIIWLHPDLPRLTNEQRAQNMAAVSRLVEQLSERRRIPSR